jgi:hypothetical protein
MSIIANSSLNNNYYCIDNLDENNKYLIIFIFLLNFIYYIMYL